MSLIYSALNSLDREPGATSELADQNTAFAPAERRSTSRWMIAVVFCGLLAIAMGAGAIMMLRGHSSDVQRQPAATVIAARSALPLASPPAQTMPEPTPPAAVREQAPAAASPTPEPVLVAAAPALAAIATPPVITVAVAEPVKLVAPVQAAATVTPAAPVQVAAPPPALNPVESISVKVNDRPARKQAFTEPENPPPASAARNSNSRGSRPATVTEPEIDPDEAARLSLAVRQAIDAGRKEEAEALLNRLATRLPAESITLLRLRAWHALRGGDQSQARLLYGQIVDRLPDDESASINLAVLHWQSGQYDEARRLMATLAEYRPESQVVQRYSAQFAERK